jgi:hypothetical protein
MLCSGGEGRAKQTKKTANSCRWGTLQSEFFSLLSRKIKYEISGELPFEM